MKKNNEFEGATLILGEIEENESAFNKNIQLQRMNQLSKRPY
jgi:hypothetical protein